MYQSTNFTNQHLIPQIDENFNIKEEPASPYLKMNRNFSLTRKDFEQPDLSKQPSFKKQPSSNQYQEQKKTEQNTFDQQQFYSGNQNNLYQQSNIQNMHYIPNFTQQVFLQPPIHPLLNMFDPLASFRNQFAYQNFTAAQSPTKVPQKNFQMDTNTQVNTTQIPQNSLQETLTLNDVKNSQTMDNTPRNAANKRQDKQLRKAQQDLKVNIETNSQSSEDLDELALKISKPEIEEIQSEQTKVLKTNSQKNNKQQDEPEQKVLRKRGRKGMEDEEYIKTAKKKIEDLKLTYSTAKADGKTVEERQKLRNQISASMDRLKKKMQIIHLNQQVQRNEERNAQLMNILENILDKNKYKQVLQRIKQYDDENPEEQLDPIMEEVDDEEEADDDIKPNITQAEKKKNQSTELATKKKESALKAIPNKNKSARANSKQKTPNKKEIKRNQKK